VNKLENQETERRPLDLIPSTPKTQFQLRGSVQIWTLVPTALERRDAVHRMMTGPISKWPAQPVIEWKNLPGNGLSVSAAAFGPLARFTQVAEKYGISFGSELGSSAPPAVVLACRNVEWAAVKILYRRRKPTVLAWESDALREHKQTTNMQDWI
jgi:hypothetical protein